MLHKCTSLVGKSRLATSQLPWQHLLSDFAGVCTGLRHRLGLHNSMQIKTNPSHTDVAIVCKYCFIQGACTAGNYAPLLHFDSSPMSISRSKKRNSYFFAFSQAVGGSREVSWETQTSHTEFYIPSTHQPRNRNDVWWRISALLCRNACLSHLTSSCTHLSPHPH